MFQHRSSVKSGHKKYKGKSKGKLKRVNKGKVESATRAPVKNAARSSTGGRVARVNRAKQIQLQKRNAMKFTKRLGTDKGAAKIVGLVPLSPDVDLVEVARLIGGGCENDAVVAPINPRVQILRTSQTKPKQRMLVYACPRDVTAVLDIAKVADLLLFVVTPKANGTEANVDALSWQLTTVVKSQGLPTVIGLSQGMCNVASKKKLAMTKMISRFYQSALEYSKKPVPLDSEKDVLPLMRILGSTKIGEVTWRAQRAYLMAEHVEIRANTDQKTCSVRVAGHVRGEGTVAANNIVHITGHGDYSVEQIDVVTRERRTTKHSKDVDMKDSSSPGFSLTTNSRPDANQDSIAALKPLDEMNREQSIITDEEIRLAEMAANKDSTRAIPGGLSKFQGIWDEIISDDEEEQDPFQNIDTEMDDMKTYDIKSSASSMSDAKMEATTMKQKMKLERDEVDFPDEVETPHDTNARVRFARYRGLKSFPHSEWDVKENLPLEYGHLTQFEDFDAAKRRVLMQSKTQNPSVALGTHVIIQLKGVPVAVAQQMVSQEAPVLLWALLQHERQVSVMHCRVRRHPDDEEPIKQKDPMEVHVGFRRFHSRPIYAQDTGKASRTMTERFFHHGRWTITSFYSHILFPPAQVLMFRKGSGNDYEGDFKTMVASGSVLSINPDKLLLKRIVLTGNPVGVHKRSAVCRYMFYNPEDIRYFKPVELRTKYGLTGHIKEARGTKGFMKVLFDGFIKPNDTVCMHLYKRQFPKWDDSDFS